MDEKIDQIAEIVKLKILRTIVSQADAELEGNEYLKKKIRLSVREPIHEVDNMQVQEFSADQLFLQSSGWQKKLQNLESARNSYKEEVKQLSNSLVNGRETSKTWEEKMNREMDETWEQILGVDLGTGKYGL